MTDEIIRGHCPDRGPDRFADVIGRHQSRYDDQGSGVWGWTDYRILECRGCDTAHFQTDEVFSENSDHRQNPATGGWEEHMLHKITHYPAPFKRVAPEWTYDLDLADRELGSLLGDVYGVLNAELRVLAAVAARTVFDRASELLGVDPATTFAEKLDELTKQGKISAMSGRC